MKKNPAPKPADRATPETTDETTAPNPKAGVALGVLAFLSSLLAVFQWMELLVLQAGGKSICALSTSVNCEAVWRLPIAKWLHANLGLPVAGLGLVWAGSALVVALWVLGRRRGDFSARSAVAAARLVGVVGILASVALGGVSMAAGVVCPTCLVTYVLALAYGLVAIFALPRPVFPAGAPLLRGAAWTVAVAVALHLALLVPGRATPRTGEIDLPTPPTLAPPSAGNATAPSSPGRAPNAEEAAVAKYIEQLTPGQQSALAQSLAVYRASPHIDPNAFAPRVVDGPQNAPVRIVEWTDVLCGHCAELMHTMRWVKKMAPPGSFSLEARHFPLDSSCNPELMRTEPGALRCEAARAMVCLERLPDFWALRDKMFESQASLSRERVLQIATSSGSIQRAELEACMRSPATDATIKGDVAYAMRYRPEGTPLVTINGRAGSALPAFLFSIVAAKGDPESPAFAKVPRVAPPKGGH